MPMIEGALDVTGKPKQSVPIKKWQVAPIPIPGEFSPGHNFSMQEFQIKHCFQKSLAREHINSDLDQNGHTLKRLCSLFVTVPRTKECQAAAPGNQTNCSFGRSFMEIC